MHIPHFPILFPLFAALVRSPLQAKGVSERCLNFKGRYCWALAHLSKHSPCIPCSEDGAFFWFPRTKEIGMRTHEAISICQLLSQRR